MNSITTFSIAENLAYKGRLIPFVTRFQSCSIGHIRFFDTRDIGLECTVNSEVILVLIFSL